MNRRLPWWLVLLLVAACGETPAPADIPAAPEPAAPARTPAPAPVAVADPLPAAAPGAFALEARSGTVAARATDAPVLVDVRAAEHEGFDRIVFEFQSDGLPQWIVDWVEIPITHCGSGQVVPVSGTAWLQVRFNGAAAHTPEGKPTSGPAQRRLRHPVVRDLARICDFEGEVTWVAGLAGQHPYRVDVLSAPPRLVVDIVH